MVADADRDALLVEHLAHVVGVDVAEREGDRRAASSAVEGPMMRRSGSDWRRWIAYAVSACSWAAILSMPMESR